MINQPNRFALGTHSPFAGSGIDRSQPLSFRLNGRVIHGFAGDTVLSAALASGIDTAGERRGASIALSARHAPPIAAAGDKTTWLPMERVPATDGADYVAAGSRTGILSRMGLGGGRSLGLDLGRPDALARPWLSMPGEAGPTADLVVVGGGVAGMSAALAGAKRGLRTVLVDAAPQLGGKARLFGTQDGEETPDEAISRLAAALAKSADITVLGNAEVFAVRPGVVRLHQVELREGKPSGRVLDIRSARIILATGALERLPIFPGNRLPGVSAALEAYELARVYGVWPGRSTLIATGGNPVYRLATLARDAGIAVPRILDPRPSPQSRFIEFSKAYGITLSPGTTVAAAAPGRRSHGLMVVPQSALDGFPRQDPPLQVDRLLVSGGWQPDLSLWHMAGGQSAWNMAAKRLEPKEAPAGIALAGSAAGWMGRGACLASGSDAVDLLLGRERSPVTENLIDPLYETPDAPAWMADAPQKTVQPAFLDGGSSYVSRPQPRRSRWPLGSKHDDWSLATTPHPLDINDIAAGVQLGAIPPASAGIVAQERVAMVRVEHEGSDKRPAQPLAMPPAYLFDRFRGAGLWLISPSDQRLLDVGALIFLNADDTDPLKAIGVVVRVAEGKAIALAAGVPGQVVSVREGSSAVRAALVAPSRDELNLALGGSAGAA